MLESKPLPRDDEEGGPAFEPLASAGSPEERVDRNARRTRHGVGRGREGAAESGDSRWTRPPISRRHRNARLGRTDTSARTWTASRNPARAGNNDSAAFEGAIADTAVQGRPRHIAREHSRLETEPCGSSLGDGADSIADRDGYSPRARGNRAKLRQRGRAARSG